MAHSISVPRSKWDASRDLVAVLRGLASEGIVTFQFQFQLPPARPMSKVASNSRLLKLMGDLVNHWVKLAELFSVEI